MSPGGRLPDLLLALLDGLPLPGEQSPPVSRYDVCWQAFCSQCSSPSPELMAFIQWLTLASATLNPIVYTGFNSLFRTAIRLTVTDLFLLPRRYLCGP